ncbi:hypothetical protein Tco_1546885 [Tanacetum coccineum]
MQPVAPPSPDYIPGPEDPQTPLVPQDEDEREPMFIQAHDPDYVAAITSVDFTYLLSHSGYVLESDPEEDPEEYEDDETEDGPVDYPIDGGDDGDDDDGDSSGDDADGEDEDDEDEEEEEEHLAPADSAIVVPVDKLIFPPEGTVLFIPPPSIWTLLLGLRITRLSRCTSPPAHSSPLLPSSGSPTQIQTLRIASTQALIDVVTAALPSPPLPPSLYIPPPVDRRDDIPESEQPPRKSTVDAEARRSGISEVGYGIRDTWVDLAEVVPEITPMTAGEVNTRITELAELHERDTHDLYSLLEDAQDRDRMDGGGGGLCFPRGLGSLDRIESGDSSGASNPS